MKIDAGNLIQALPQEADGKSRLMQRIEQSVGHLSSAALESGLRRWIVMYSGGKDSTAALILAIKAAQTSGAVEQLDVIFSNTGVEIPTLEEHALNFLDKLEAPGVNLKKHVVRPSQEHAFWLLIIGKGYPPPHRNFRWCTTKLKVAPAEQVIKAVLRPGRSAIITGVRFGESDARDLRLKLSCGRGGECGQGLWAEHSSRLNAVYLGPIVNWRECDVWDFLDVQAPEWGYATSSLKHVYHGPQTRFGCWTCTVVQRDKTMTKLTATEDGKKFLPLAELRDWLIEFGRDHAHRVRRANGAPGRLTLAARRQILNKVSAAEQLMGESILSQSDRDSISEYWADDKYGDTYQ